MKSILALSLFSILLFSCSSSSTRSCPDNAICGDLSQVSLFPNIATAIAPKNGSIPDTISVNIEMVTREVSRRQEIPYVIDESSTAVEGEHYQLLDTSPVTVEKDTFVQPIRILILSNETIADSVLLNLRVMGNEDFEPAQNLDTYHLTIKSADMQN